MTYPIAYATSARRAELRSMPYAEYLRTTEWAQVRWCALNEGCHRCRLCGALDALEVHHNDYTTRGGETLADVVVLCDGCHERHHLAHPPVTDAAGTPPPAPGDPELERMRGLILAARARGDHQEADRLTREREKVWRSLCRRAA